mmetsp:Transcript_6978/g.8042  ORF Transcript_6978/g.8042 Transcript_6978/m.8042 type:complete len:106 (-) Transcript_6978:1107-1424(-)
MQQQVLKSAARNLLIFPGKGFGHGSSLVGKHEVQKCISTQLGYSVSSSPVPTGMFQISPVRNMIENDILQCVGRNSRKIKKANHGKKPCNRTKRKRKRLRVNSGW